MSRDEGGRSPCPCSSPYRPRPAPVGTTRRRAEGRGPRLRRPQREGKACGAGTEGGQGGEGRRAGGSKGAHEAERAAVGRNVLQHHEALHLVTMARRKRASWRIVGRALAGTDGAEGHVAGGARRWRGGGGARRARPVVVATGAPMGRRMEAPRCHTV
jgi:hypothetical protein